MGATHLAWDDVVNMQWFFIATTVTTDASISIEYSLLMNSIASAIKFI
jgi:hypothetical protein